MRDIYFSEPQVNQNKTHPQRFFVINIGSDFNSEQFSLWASFLKDKINSLELNIRYWLSKKKRNFIIVILVNIFGAILYFGIPAGGIIFIIYSVSQMLVLT